MFAVIPAAGESRRMGRPKLLLPLGDKTVIALLLEVLDQPAIADRFVVVRADDEPLRAAVTTAGATVVTPDVPPPDMRASVQAALDEIARKHSPSDEDGWLLVPADHPVLWAEVIELMQRRFDRGDCRILVPTCEGRRGHPTIFGWELTKEVADLPTDVGLNTLLRIHADDVVELPVDDPRILIDLDTPEDYRKLRDQI
jgi:molybdenum cofactor cytidylyltransferase